MKEVGLLWRKSQPLNGTQLVSSSSQVTESDFPSSL